MLDLREMLTYRRPHRSRSERKFINRFIRPFSPDEDAFGNLIVRVGDDLRLGFACHTDTVDSIGGRRKVFGSEKGFLYTDRTEACLGADDTTGVWMMLNLIERGVNGLYLFHRAEEIGCQGSSWIVKNTPSVVDETECIISLDRRGYDSVVTHQCGMRTCSDEFAESLIAALGMQASMQPDPSGLFTDSMEYAWDVPECTNISVGYEGQHSGRESQDFGFAVYLLNRLSNLNADDLFIYRDHRYDWEQAEAEADAEALMQDDDDRYRAWTQSYLRSHSEPVADYGLSEVRYCGIKTSDIEWDDDYRSDYGG